MLDEKEYGGEPRPYLGMSSSGEPCQRKRWYGFHWAEIHKHSARMDRIFSVGHLFEEVMITELKRSGLDVYLVVDGERKEMTGKLDESQEEMMGFAGHEKGHNDGRVMGVLENPTLEHLLELKTAKHETFKEVVARGVRNESPVYYGQAQRYMLELGLKAAMFIMISKNTCEIYIEIIDFDEVYAKELRRLASGVIMTDSPPPRHYIKSFYKCTPEWCGSANVCWNEAEPEHNCRTCDYSDLADNGKWECTNGRHVDEVSGGQCQDEYNLSTEEQRKGCDQWKKGWGL